MRVAIGPRSYDIVNPTILLGERLNIDIPTELSGTFFVAYRVFQRHRPRQYRVVLISIAPYLLHHFRLAPQWRQRDYRSYIVQGACTLALIASN